MKKKIIVLSLFILICLLALSLKVTRKENIIKPQASGVVFESNDNVEKIENKEEKVSEKNIVKIDIKGAVVKPGVYEIENNKRVVDVIELAGGTTKEANTNYINLSTKVTDEMVIWVYTNKEIEELKLKESSVQYMVKECNCPVVDNTTCLSSSSKESKNTSLVNINTATIEDLMSLNGIGENKAKSIIDYRNKNGKYKTIEDIMNVTGIGESVYNKIKEYIEV